MRFIDAFIRRAARSQNTLPLKERVGKRLREIYYNAEVLYRIEDKTAPLNYTVDKDAPRRVNLLIPEINFSSFYGGYMAKFHLARKLVAAGYSVRLVIVDPSEHAPKTWKEAVSGYAGLERIFDEADVVYQGDRRNSMVVSPMDRVIATTWWTAYIADEITQRLEGPPFVYLIQEYEPFTFPMGSYYAMAHHSYSFAHRGLFSSGLLEEYFRLQGIGAFARNGQTNHFENAIVSFNQEDIKQALQRKQAAGENRKKRLLFYSRPEAHATRNMFEVAFLALAGAIKEGVFDETWEFHGIGSGHGDIDLPGARKLRMLGKFSLGEYRKALLEYDLGLSLMYTPHPSLLPLDMTSAGMVVVTNSCANKTPGRLQALSRNLIGAEPHIEGVREGLRQAQSISGDMDRRLSGSRVQWASDWDESFHDGVMQNLKDWLA